MASSGTDTPPFVEEHATQQANLQRTALLGIFGPETAPRALVRLPHGNTQTVSVGDVMAGGTVQAITKDRLVLSRRGSAQILRMPQS